MEFLIKAVEGTTAGMLCNLGKGDKVELSQVMGSGFRVDQIAPAEDYPTILLFATGSGIRWVYITCQSCAILFLSYMFWVLQNFAV
jgi:hypothetical protein